MNSANDFKLLMSHWADIMEANRNYLIQLDSVVGDGDLGLTMSDGFRAASDAIARQDQEDIGKLAYLAGKAMLTAVPSTMGTLMASGLMAAGKAVVGHKALDLEGVTAFFQGFCQGVMERGKAQPGEKTFLDGMVPAVESLQEDCKTGASLKNAALGAARCAHEGFLATRGMPAKHGRAAGRGEDSRDILDPGAAVADFLMKGYAEFMMESGANEI